MNEKSKRVQKWSDIVGGLSICIALCFAVMEKIFDISGLVIPKFIMVTIALIFFSIECGAKISNNEKVGDSIFFIFMTSIANFCIVLQLFK